MEDNAETSSHKEISIEELERDLEEAQKRLLEAGRLNLEQLDDDSDSDEEEEEALSNPLLHERLPTVKDEETEESSKSSSARQRPSRNYKENSLEKAIVVHSER